METRDRKEVELVEAVEKQLFEIQKALEQLNLRYLIRKVEKLKREIASYLAALRGETVEAHVFADQDGVRIFVPTPGGLKLVGQFERPSATEIRDAIINFAVAELPNVARDVYVLLSDVLSYVLWRLEHVEGMLSMALHFIDFCRHAQREPTFETSTEKPSLPS